MGAPDVPARILKGVEGELGTFPYPLLSVLNLMIGACTITGACTVNGGSHAPSCLRGRRHSGATPAPPRLHPGRTHFGAAPISGCRSGVGQVSDSGRGKSPSGRGALFNEISSRTRSRRQSVKVHSMPMTADLVNKIWLTTADLVNEIWLTTADLVNEIWPKP